METPDVEIRVTADGSLSLYRPDLDEGYHSRHGAIQESRHVFIAAGLEYWHTQHPEATEIRVFEVGFGTGLNALLTRVWAEIHQVRVRYTAVERYPLPEKVWRQLHYPVGEERAFIELHQAAWGDAVQLDPYFVLVKIYADLRDILLEKQVDIIYYDAFAPEKQPELWEESVFSRVHSLQRLGGVLVTYCAKGQVRRNMIAAGYQTERIPGPPGKRQMLRALKMKHD